MLLQNTLDLSTFEIVRFRIWNQTSHPDDKGVGTKYFNTNSGHEGYNRENIYTATGWRRTAYMDDIDRINEKLDLIFGEEIDTDTIIDSWKEVQDFLAGIEDTENLMMMLGGKLNKTGGTMTGNLVMENSAIRFTTSGDGGYLSYSSSKGFFVANNAWDKEYTLIHTGNVGDYALKRVIDVTSLDSVNAGEFFLSQYGATSVPEGNCAGGITLQTFKDTLGADYRAQLAFSTNANAFVRRYIKGTWESWKTIAFTDSDITGNAGSATKLKESVSLWGNEFDGTQSLGGNINLPNSRSIKYYLSDKTTLANVIQVNEYNTLMLGQGIAQNSGDTAIYGNTIKFCYGTAGSSSQTAMTITEEGNVVLNTDNPLSRRFAVGAGGTFLYAKASAVTLGEHGDDTVLIGSGAYGMQLWADPSSAASNIQAMNYGGTATAYALNLNPLGGAVNVGEGGLNVAGAINSNDRIYTPFLFLGKGQEGIYLDNAGIAWHDTSNSWSGTLLKFSNDLVRITQSTRIEGELLATGLTSFSSRVLIGGALDDGGSALQVEGTTRFGNLKNHVLVDLYGLTLNINNPAGGWNRIIRFALDNNAVGTIGGYGNDNSLSYVYIGESYTSTWAKFNSTEVNLDVLTKFNGGALIPSGQTLTIGSVTFRETAEGEVEVDGNLHTTGTLASGGKAQEGTGSTGNAMVYQYDLASGESIYTVDNVKGSTNVIVQIYEWNSNTSSWDMILTDVSVKASGITVTFGRTTTVNHMVTVC